MPDIELPRRVTVKAIEGGRYLPGTRPDSWDKRYSGLEEVRLVGGEVVTLWSSGGQSTPNENWELMLTSKRVSEEGSTCYEWTLYGLPK